MVCCCCAQAVPEGSVSSQEPGCVLVRGLHLVGACWDASRSCLALATASCSTSELPTLLLQPCSAEASASSADHDTSETVLALALHQAIACGGAHSGRGCIAEVQFIMPSAKDDVISEWLLQGAALSCSAL